MKTKMLIVLAASIALLAACKGKSGGYELVNNKSSAAADTAAIAADTGITLKLIKTAEINFKVKNVQQVSENIAALTTQFGGMVMHHQLQATVGATKDIQISNDSVKRVSAFNTTGDMTLKVPSQKLEDFMNRVGHMGIYVNIRKMDIDDKSLDYLASKLKLKDRRELVSQQRSGKIKIKDPADVLALKDDMDDKQIGNLRTNEQVKFSVIGLSFYQSDTILAETIANDDPSAYNIPVFQRLGLAFISGWDIFVDVMVGLVNLWVFAVAGLAVWAGIRYYRKRPRLSNGPVA